MMLRSRWLMLLVILPLLATNFFSVLWAFEACSRTTKLPKQGVMSYEAIKNLVSADRVHVIGEESWVVSFQNSNSTPTFALEYHGAQVLVSSEYTKQAPNEDDVTWAVQFTLDRIDVFQETLRRWKGPVTCVIYSRDFIVERNQIASLLGRVDVHIVPASQGFYPVNTLRNLAMDKVRTRFVLLTDVDFVPNEQIYEFISRRLPTWKEELHLKKLYVIPAFQMTDGSGIQHIPRSKEDIKTEWESTVAMVHPEATRRIAHAPTDYDQWLKTNDEYNITYQFPYEPYFVAPVNIPRYDARFVGYGNDKATHAYELSLEGYRFVGVPDCFVFHAQHESGPWVSETITNQRDRMDKLLMQFFVDMDKKTRLEKSNQVLMTTRGFKLVPAKIGTMCSEACDAHDNRVCDSRMFSAANRCDSMRSVFDCRYGCLNQYYDSSLPSFDENKKICYLNANPSRAPFDCDSRSDTHLRLCPCVTRGAHIVI